MGISQIFLLRDLLKGAFKVLTMILCCMNYTRILSELVIPHVVPLGFTLREDGLGNATGLSKLLCTKTSLCVNFPL